MSDRRRGRRPSLLPVTSVAQVTPAESTEGAPPSAASDVEQVPRAPVEEEQTEAPSKDVVY